MRFKNEPLSHEPPPPRHEGLYSGNWRGFYAQIGRTFPQQQRMEFADGIVRGEGADGIGTFVIEGEYRADGANEVRIGWARLIQTRTACCIWESSTGPAFEESGRSADSVTALNLRRNNETRQADHDGPLERKRMKAT
jgi:hypothetical protein